MNFAAWAKRFGKISIHSNTSARSGTHGLDREFSRQSHCHRYRTIYIYFIEEHPDFSPAVGQVFEALDRGEFKAITSTVTLLEVLVHPLRKNQPEIAERYRSILLTAENLTTVAVLPAIAEIAARLRALHGVKTPDAVQMATAIHMGATTFVTNDRTLHSIDSLEIVLITDLA